MHAVLVEPCAGGMIKLLHMLQVPRRQERKQGRKVDSFIVVHLIQSRVEPAQQLQVCRAVLIHSGEGVATLQFLFSLEMLL
jgi:hypothetical protein